MGSRSHTVIHSYTGTCAREVLYPFKIFRCLQFFQSIYQERLQMTSKREKCGFSSLLPISCRDHAEAFARSLQTRLSSLGGHTNSSDERSWLGPHDKPIALSQPLHSTDAERYLELETLESPCSPQEELEESELHRLLNKDTLKEGLNGDCHCPKITVIQDQKHLSRSNGIVRHHSVDSDSEVFYDLDDDPPAQPYLNGIGNSESSRSMGSETSTDANSQATSSSNPSDAYATSLDCTPQPSVSDDLSTLSVKEDNSLLDVNTDKDTTCEECVKTREEEDHSVSESGKIEDVTKPSNEEASTNGEGEETMVNGENSSNTFVSNLTVTNELMVECVINTDDNTVEEPKVTEVIISKNNDDDDEDNDEVIPRVRRCSSLKTGKTPPGTPGRKKIVRFADVLGLDLADVRTFLDEVPKVPKSAYNDLSDADISESTDIHTVNALNKYHGIVIDKFLLAQFDQPAGRPNFLDLVRENLVCLENAVVDDPILFLIKGTVRVRNLDFHKSVHVRYTLDSWKTFADVQATYVANSCDGFSDRFSFVIYAHTLTVGQRLEFACRFQCKGCQYWDSNKGNNYCFQCLPAATSSTLPISNHGHNDWGASFY
ncbi:glycogen binding subunit 76A isoform X2 [Rhynchophorus ferrugineus]|uniref:glycogen binding subunit 76A isoform X2 n=1 Tax=Rhynchophorus ferrugineus TaxID=354439 RepID=UPI003FCD33A9